MSLYKQKLNPVSGQFNLVSKNTAIKFKDSVPTSGDLPATGNDEGDGRLTQDTNNLYIWDGSSWVNQGDILDLSWSAISGKPSSAVADIDDAVSKRHTQGTDQGLDTGGANATTAADVKDAVDKKHTQGTDSYDASDITNDSSVVGSTVKDALNQLQADAVETTQYTKSSMADDEEWTITHPSDSSFKRFIQLHRDVVEVDNTLDFDTADEADFTQEDSSKTEFKADALELDSDVDSYTKGLFHLNGTEGSTVFTDSSFYAHSTSHNGTVSLTQVEKKFGTASASFAGVDDNYIKTESHADYSIGTDDWTVDGWVYATDLSHAATVSLYGATADGFWMLAYVTATQKFIFWASSNPMSGWNIYNAALSSVQAISLNTWHHVAISFDGSNYRIFFNGTKIFDGANAATITANTTGFQFGGLGYAGQGAWKGYMDEVRFSKGIARWTANFTPPTVQYKNYDDTQFWYVHTNVNQIDTSIWETIDSIAITQTTPANTDLRYLLSVDGRTTWKKWNGSAWESVLLSNISTGNTKAELEALDSDDFDLLFSAGTLDIAVGLKTTDDEVTPSLTQIDITYPLIGKLICKDSEFDISIESATQTKVKNVSGGTLSNIRAQIAI